MSALTSRGLAMLLGEWRADATAAVPRPLYEVLADRIRLLVLDGRIALGVRLPAERALAAHEGLSRTTVAGAYARLRDLGYLRSVRGSGSVVQLPPGDAPPMIGAPGTGLIDFSSASLPAVPLIAEAAREAAELLPRYLEAPGFDLLGLPELRAAIAERCTRAGVPTGPDEIMITLGAQHALALVARTLIARGDRVLIESPTYPHAIEALRGAGGRLVTVPVTTDEGWDDEALARVFARSSPALAYLMPDFHNPTTRVMLDEQRARVAALAEAHGTVLVVDETMADLGFEGSTATPMAAFGPGVVTLGSVGKSIWGGIRLGWIRADRALITRLAVARSAGDLGSPTLEQLVLLRLLDRYDRVLDARRAQLVAGHALMARELARRFPSWSVPEVGGGLTFWVGIGAPVASRLALAARAEGVLIGAGPRFGIDGAFERFVRIPFCRPEEESLRALDALQRAWTGLGEQPAPPAAGGELLETVV
ncbi:PLP-dependent aminotransferase family protein [Microcella daejeonensis]|uniref:PLP-dependent aminotransferase family protein n=1 Tax=Microcella daejeonensis TaxID=2994971 RepID=A0A9E8MM47_9MICO|nr:PLP-dependent aminotransferase family protein [Microcella daejeonensis]WAB82165.1 PLP-dependent aminotransferase family protein [Microcella daejeonensis]